MSSLNFLLLSSLLSCSSISSESAGSYGKRRSIPFSNMSTSSPCIRSQSLSCPVWAYCDNISTTCKCLKKNGYIFKCDQYGRDNYILSCYCLTYDGNSRTAEVGFCYYNCDHVGKSKFGVEIFYDTFPDNSSDWNEAMCGVYNRTGTLCGQCVNNTYLPAYSYDMTCRTCGSRLTSLIKYITVAYGLLTLFCVIVVATRLNVPSSQLQGYVFFCQVVSCPIFARSILFYLGDGPEATKYKIVPQVLGSFVGVWNLDFLRWLNLGICIEVNPLTILSLEFFVAVYPLFITIITYAVINLLDSNGRSIVSKLIHVKIFPSWNVKSSTIDAFATFFFLSNTKFLNVCYDLLVPVQVCEPSINGMCKYAVFTDATVPYFGHRHFPYAILALAVLIVFVFIPILFLIMYPFKCCHFILEKLPLRYQIWLNTLMDSFQGCYKDGTEPRTRDCRWFSAVPFIVRFLIFILYGFTIASIFLSYCVILLVITALLIIIVDPHKSQFKHHSHHFTIFILLLCCSIMCAQGYSSGLSNAKFFYCIVILIGFLQLSYICVLACRFLKIFVTNVICDKLD